MIKNATKEDLKEIYLVCNEQLGFNYLPLERLNKLFDNKSTIIRIKMIEDNIAGFALCEVLNNDEIVEQVRDKALLNKEEKSFGFIDIVATKEEYKGKGIASSLVQDCLKELLERGIKQVFSAAWKDKDNINIGKVLEKSGLIPAKEIKNYYYEESLNKGYNCPNCGNPPCKCSAVIFVRNI